MEMPITNRAMYAIALASAMLLLGVAAAGPHQAMAATKCKASVQAKGMFYKGKTRARNSARGRWTRQAAARHGAKFAFWGKAKSKSIKCTYGHGRKGKLYNCRARARPCRQFSACRGTVKAKGMFYKGKTRARNSARGRWTRQAAARHGAKFAFWGKAKSKSIKCTYGHSKRGKLYNCTARARACR